MRKEIFVAITFGFIIGLVIVFGIITARSALNAHQSTTNTGNEASAPSPTPTGALASHRIIITDPADGAVVDSDTVTLHGTTTPGSNIVMTTEKNDTIITADDAGLFSYEMTLTSGENEIDVISFSPSEERTETTITIVLSTAEF